MGTCLLKVGLAEGREMKVKSREILWGKMETRKPKRRLNPQSASSLAEVRETPSDVSCWAKMGRGLE